jgi:DNA polymerase-3 subunit delta'
VRLEPVAEARIVELLEEDGAPEETALLAARLADGDFERARILTEDPLALERRNFWVQIPPRLLTPVDAQDIGAEILAEAKVAVKHRERAQKDELSELADSIGEGRGTGGARTALAKRHKRELRRLEEDVLGEALSALASFYRDVVILRAGGAEGVTNLDLIPELETWAASDVSDRHLLRAAERCIEVRASFVSNANASLAIEAALLEISTIVAPPVSTPSSV